MGIALPKILVKSSFLVNFYQKNILMELFERVKAVARQLSGSDSALAEALGLRQNTFSYYLTAKTQTKLWEHLPKILELHPQVRRDWLYFGEGEMLADAGSDVSVPPLRTALPPMKAALAREGEPGKGDMETLRAENNSLKDKLIKALEENTRLHERIHRLSLQAEAGQWGFKKKGSGQAATPGAAVPGVPSSGIRG